MMALVMSAEKASNSSVCAALGSVCWCDASVPHLRRAPRLRVQHVVVLAGLGGGDALHATPAGVERERWNG
jgi:hypothetical protein